MLADRTPLWMNGGQMPKTKEDSTQTAIPDSWSDYRASHWMTGGELLAPPASPLVSSHLESLHSRPQLLQLLLSLLDSLLKFCM